MEGVSETDGRRPWFKRRLNDHLQRPLARNESFVYAYVNFVMCSVCLV